MGFWQIASAFADTVADTTTGIAGASGTVQPVSDVHGTIITALIGGGVALLVGLLMWRQARRQNEMLRQQNEILERELKQQREQFETENRRQHEQFEEEWRRRLEHERQQRQEADDSEAIRLAEAEETDEDRYRKWVVNQHRFLNIAGMRARTTYEVELEQVYVSLSVDPRDLAQVEGEEDRPRRRKTGMLPRVHGSDDKGKGISISRALSLVDQDRFSGLVVLGGPGTGKTTVLKYLALAYARELQQERLAQPRARLPLFVTLRDLTPERCGHSLAEYLSAACEAAGLRVSAGFFAKKLETGEGIALLDGLDEVADEAQRRLVAGWVEQQCRTFSQTPFVVTCRVAGFREEYLPPGFLRLVIQNFDEDDVARFARNWCLAADTMVLGNTEEARQKAEQDSADLVRAIEANSRVKTLAVNPLMLSIIALVHRRDVVLPERRVDLYERCMDVLLMYWDEAKWLPVPIPPGKSLQVLQPLALWLHEQKQGEEGERIARREEIEPLIAPHLVSIGLRAVEARGFLDSIRDRSGLLVERSLDVFQFQHQTFQEYLAAREIAARDRVDLLLDHFGEDYWREVILLYAGIRDASDFLGRVLDLPDPLVMKHWPLVLQVSEEALAVNEGTRQALAIHPFVVLKRSTEPVTAARAAIHVRGAFPGISPVVQAFEEAREPLVKGHLALLLGETGGPWAGEVLERHLADPDSHVRHLCALALDVLGYEPRQALDDLLLVRVPAGEFTMGGSVHDDEKPVRQVGTGAFLVDRFPLTNGQYRKFAKAGGYRERRYWSTKGWKWREEKKVVEPVDLAGSPLGVPSAPVVGISWYEAEAYAHWAGKRLMTEQEWERTARGDQDSREYPWGNEFDPGRCNTREGGIGLPTPVGSYPGGISPYGCYDMAGNVWEWTGSVYRPDELGRVVRGGSWNHSLNGARCASRSWPPPESRVASLGVRFSRTS